MNAIRTLAVILAAMLASGSVRAQDVSSPPQPAPGRLIDVGGWRLHLHCTGEAREGRPTVILETGIGDFSVEWSLVQPRVAPFARVCSYDRAGDGWSELGPSRRTLHQIVYELHTLLQKANERPPYVMVGHSYGGWLVQLYVSTYPTDVAGLALIEPGESDPLRLTADGSVKRSSELPAPRSIPPIKTSAPLRESDVPPAALAQMKTAAQRAQLDPNPGERQKLPVDAQRMRAWALGRWQHIAATFNPFELEELAALRADHARSAHPLGDRPLIVVTRGRPDETGPDADKWEAEHRKDHTALAALSTRGTLLIAQQSAHHVQLDQPELVATTIAELMSTSRAQAVPPRQFDVASVKADTSSRYGTTRRDEPDGMTYLNVTLGEFIRLAYEVQSYQIDGPAWINSGSSRFDIVAKASAPLTERERHAALVPLLAERFQLKLHHETRTLPVYSLVIDKGGPKFKEGDGGESRVIPDPATGAVRYVNYPMSAIAALLSAIPSTGRPVLDRTGLAGKYTFTANLFDLPGGLGAADAKDAIRRSETPSFTALREQLGLRLDADRAALDILVIDNAEQVPTPD